MAELSQDLITHALLGRVNDRRLWILGRIWGWDKKVPVRHKGEEDWIAGSGATVSTKPSTESMFDYLPAELGTNISVVSGEAIPIEGFGTLVHFCESQRIDFKLILSQVVHVPELKLKKIPWG